MNKQIKLSILLLFGFMFILFPIVDGKTVKLDSCITQNNYDNGSLVNSTIRLYTGWNLIGNPTDRAIALNELIFTNASGSYNYNQAHSTGFINLSTVDESGLNIASNIAVPTMINKYEAYWVYAREAGNLTLPNVRSAGAGKTFKLSELMFSNGTSEMNLSEAVANGWVAGNNLSNTVYYNTMVGSAQIWKTVQDYAENGYNSCQEMQDDLAPLIVNCEIGSSRGYFIKGLRNNINLIIPNQTETISLTNGWNGISFSSDSINITSGCKTEKPKVDKQKHKNKQKIKIMIPRTNNADEPVYNYGQITIKLPDLILLG